MSASRELPCGSRRTKRRDSGSFSSHSSLCSSEIAVDLTYVGTGPSAVVYDTRPGKTVLLDVSH